MKKIFKLMRSITTSLLFICLVVLILISIFLTFIKSDKKDLIERIDRDYIVDTILKEESYGGEYKDVYLNYVDRYINYVFHKKSFPSVEINNYSIQESDVKNVNNNLNKLKEKLNLDYNTILKIRKVYNFIDNNSVYMLVFFGIILIFLVICILYIQFKKGIKLLSIAILVSTFVALLAFLYFKILIDRIYFLNLIKHFFLLGDGIGSIYKILGIYSFVGVLLFILFIFCKKIDKN